MAQLRQGADPAAVRRLFPEYNPHYRPGRARRTGAFTFARLRWKYRNALFLVVLATVMRPRQVTLIPTFILITRVFGWKDTFYPLIVPSFFAAPFFVFLRHPVLPDAALRSGRRRDDRRLLQTRRLLAHHCRWPNRPWRPSPSSPSSFTGTTFSIPSSTLRQGQMHAGSGPALLARQLRDGLALPDDGVAGRDAARDPRLLLRAAHFHPGRRVSRLQVDLPDRLALA